MWSFSWHYEGMKEDALQKGLPAPDAAAGKGMIVEQTTCDSLNTFVEWFFAGFGLVTSESSNNEVHIHRPYSRPLFATLQHSKVSPSSRSSSTLLTPLIDPLTSERLRSLATTLPHCPRTHSRLASYLDAHCS